ncbi:zinc knuckle CX2CX4HX4C containing protein, partial [Tanacetum coccineum]
MKDLVANQLKTKEDDEITMSPRCSSLLQNKLPPKEQDPGSFILPCSIRRLDFNNAFADLGASINVIPFSMYKRLGMGNTEPINMVIKMADNTKCTPKGIVKNLLVKIDKFIFPVDFIILDMVEDFRMPINLGRPLIATTHAKVDIFKKSISLEVGNERVIFKMRCSFTTTIFEYVRAIRCEISMGDDNLMNIDYDLFLYESESCEFNHLLAIDPDIFIYDIDVQESYEEVVYRMIEQGDPWKIEEIDEANMEQHLGLTPIRKPKVYWCKAILQQKESGHEYWVSCDPYSDICDGGDSHDDKKKRYWESTNDNEDDDNEENLEDSEEYGEDKANTIIRVVHEKLNDDWFNGTSEDEDELEGIIDCLKPKSYNGFIDLDDETYNEIKCKLPGITYRKPSPILIEKVEVIRYTIGIRAYKIDVLI